MHRELFLYCRRTLFRRCGSTVAALLALILFISSVCSVFTLALSLFKSYNGYIFQTYGSYTGIAAIEKADAFIEDGAVAEQGGCYIYGDIAGDYGAGAFSAGYLDSAAAELLNIRLLDGRFPENENEALIEENFLKRLPGAALGSTLSFDISAPFGTASREYYISGVIADYSVYQRTGDEESPLLPSLITGAEDSLFVQSENFCIFRCKNNSADEVFAISEKHSVKTFLSPGVYGSVAAAVGKTAAAILIIAVSAVLTVSAVLLASFSALSSVLTASQLRFLKIAGASLDTLLKFAIINLALLFVIAFPVGLALGVGLGYFLFVYIAKGFVDFYVFSVPFTVVELSILTAFLLLLAVRIAAVVRFAKKPPLQAQTKKEALRKKPSLHLCFSLFDKWSRLSFRANRSSYAGIVLAMSLCYFVLFVCGFFTQTVKSDIQTKLSDNYILRSGGMPEYFTMFMVDPSPASGFSQSDIDGFLNNSETGDIFTVKNLDVQADVPYEKAPGLTADNLEKEYGDAAQLEKEQRFFGIQPQGELYSASLRVCKGAQLPAFLKSRGISGFDSERDVILTVPQGVRSPYAVGDSVRLFYVLAKNGYSDNSADFSVTELNLRLAAVEESDTDGAVLKKFGAGELNFICDIAAVKGLPQSWDSVYINLSDMGVHAKTDEGLRVMRGLYPQMKLYSEIENRAEQEKLLNILLLLAVSVSGFITAVVLFNIINILSLRYKNNRQLWGTLRAMGIRRPLLIRRHIGEMLLTSLSAAGLNATTLFILSFLPVRSDVEFFSPFVFVGYALGTLTVCLCTLPVPLSVFRRSVVSDIEYI